MMRMTFLKCAAAASLAALLLSGCAAATFQFTSDPEGAVIRTSAGGGVIGTAPCSFTVDKDSLKLSAALRLRGRLGIRRPGRHGKPSLGLRARRVRHRLPLQLQPAEGRPRA